MRSITITSSVLTAILVLSGGGAAQAVLEPSWTSTVDAGGFDLAQGVAFVADGGVIITGTAYADDDQDAVTMRLGPDGTRVWTRVFAATSADRSEAVAVAGDRIYVAGGVSTALGDDAYLQAYDLSGTLAWTTTLDKGTSEVARSVAVAADGSVIMAGVSVSVNGADGFVAKFDADGEEQWARPINIFAIDEAFAVAVDEDGAAYVAGRLIREGTFHAFLRKVDADGGVEWTRFVASDDMAEARGVAVADGRVCLTGTYAQRDGDARVTDLLVSCYTSGGEPLWERQVEVSGDDDEGRGAVFDASGNLVVVGFGVVDGNKNPFALKLDAAGEPLWRYVGVGAGVSGVGSVDVSPDGGKVVAAGATEGAGGGFDYLVQTYEQGVASAAFTTVASEATAGEPVAFEEASFSSGGSILEWLWDFGDGTTSTEANPSHTYGAPGEYDVTLTVVDVLGNVGRATTRLIVGGEPSPAAEVGGSPSESSEPSIEETNVPGPAVSIIVLVAVAVALLRRRG